MRCLGRTETDRKITNEPWSSKQSLTEQRRPLFGVKGVVCPKKEKREQKFIQKVLTRAGIVRDIAYEPNAPLYSALNWTEVGQKFRSLEPKFFRSGSIGTVETRWQNACLVHENRAQTGDE